MKRRHLVVLVSGFTLVAVVFVAAVIVGVGVGTDTGREEIRSLIQQQLGSRIRGKIHIGTIHGGLLAGFTVDSFAIRDSNDSLLVSAGRVSVEYDPRDLMDRRLLLHNVVVEHPFVRLQEHRQGDWNFQRIFKAGRSTPKVPGRNFGDYVVLDSVRVRDGEFLLVRPWDPDDTLRGAKRDSAIRINLANRQREIRRSSEGFTHTYRWSALNAFLPHIRLADPDSDRFGKKFIVESARVEENEPPFSFRNGRGNVKVLGDSVFADATRFELPASSGNAKAKIWWGSNLPIRLDIRIKNDNVALKDIAWVYPTLPTEGGGRTHLHIYNDPQNLHEFEYALSDMDVRSGKSRLTGAMTFVVGGPILAVRNVDLRAAPVNFDLLRRLAGAPFPVDWQGDLVGYVQGPGGPLTHFVVDRSDITWRDAHVRGAVSRVSGRGGLNIEQPAYTKFRGFDVTAENIDLRSIEYLFPGFPRIGGTVAGTARLDSSWMDVRFSNANVTHSNGPGEPSRFTGAGRITDAKDFLKFDVSINAQPVSLTMLSRAYPLALRGLLSGPIQAQGTTDNLHVVTDLTGAAGHVTYNGVVDLYPPSVGAHGEGRFDALDVSQLVDAANTPPALLAGKYQLDVRGDISSLATLRGSAALQLERSQFDSIRVFPSRIRAHFGEGRLYLDTLHVESVAATLDARGALGLTSDVSDSLKGRIVVDSIGGLRRYISRFTSAIPQSRAAGTPVDSLAGTLAVTWTAIGSIKSPALVGTLSGRNLFVWREAGRQVEGDFDLSNVREGLTGKASVRFDALNVSGMVLDSLGASIRFDRAREGTFDLRSLARNGDTFSLRGRMTTTDSVTTVAITDLALTTDSSRWALRAPAHIVRQGRAITIDSVVVTNGAGGRVSLAGMVPDTSGGRAKILFSADSVSLHDVGNVLQLRTALSGWAHASVQGGGSSESPVMRAQAMLNAVRYGGINLEGVIANADYANRRANVDLNLARGGRAVILAHGVLPIELRYFGARLLDDSLRGSIRTDSASLDIVELISGLRDATGRLAANLDITGTWKHPDLSGGLRVDSGEVTVSALGTRLQGVNVDLALFGHRDSLAIRRFVAWTTRPTDAISLDGYVAYADIDNPLLNLHLDAQSFRALDRKSLASLDVSTDPGGLTLRGRLRGATLTGGIVVDRGSIYLRDPDVRSKRIVDILQYGDTTTAPAEQLPTLPSRLLESILIEGVTVRLGDDVWLRSREANIKLAGSLNVQRSVRLRRGTILGVGTLAGKDSLGLALEGELHAERGTYTLPLGPIQREFQVESGTITFLGNSELAPQLNISALHTVRTETGSDIHIRIRLTGSLVPNPIVTLESAESFPINESDMVSYLILGQPNFEVGDQNKSYVQLAAQTLFPSAQTLAASQLRSVLGSYADFLQLRPALDPSVVGSKDKNRSYTEIFWTSRLGAEKQLTDKLFVSLSTGICQLQQQSSQSSSQLLDFYNGLSGKLQYRIGGDASIQAGKEPSALSCRTTVGRVVPTPSQWGISLFKSWRF